MPIRVEDPVYIGNTVRIIFRTYTWTDLQASADTIMVTVYKRERNDLVALSGLTNLRPDGRNFLERASGEYELYIHTDQLTPGEYVIVFAGKVGGHGFYEPIPLKLRGLREGR